jgi:hypothetical protein
MYNCETRALHGRKYQDCVRDDQKKVHDAGCNLACDIVAFDYLNKACNVQ